MLSQIVGLRYKDHLGAVNLEIPAQRRHPESLKETNTGGKKQYVTLYACLTFDIIDAD